LGYLNSVEFAYWDECHTSSVGSKWYSVCNKINAFFRYGGTGSLPIEDEKSMKLLSVTGEVIHKVTSQELEKQKLIARPIISIYTINKPKVSKELRWHDIYYSGIVTNNIRNKIIVKLIKENEKVLCLVTRLEHGSILLKELLKEGVKSEFIHGVNNVSIRQKAFSDLEKGKLDCVISSSISDEGVNCPKIETVVLAGAGASEIKLIQRLGRGMRIAEGKDSFKVIDFQDNTHKILLLHSMRRQKKYRNESFQVIEISIDKTLFD
jgi:superfamily II DNA or RNA helicase